MIGGGRPSVTGFYWNYFTPTLIKSQQFLLLLLLLLLLFYFIIIIFFTQREYDEDVNMFLE